MNNASETIVSITRHEPFTFTITTDGIDIQVNATGGFIEGMNPFGDYRIRPTEASKSPIIKDCFDFCNMMAKKYGKKIDLPILDKKAEPKKSKAKPKAKKPVKKCQRSK